MEEEPELEPELIPVPSVTAPMGPCGGERDMCGKAKRGERQAEED